MGERLALRIGGYQPAAPVVLAPMAGVTNAAFRAVCRSFAPDLVYVNEMVMATAVVYRNDKTSRMMTFAPDERPRSLQLYGSDPVMLGRAVNQLCDEGAVDHVDLNFGCPAAKVTRKGGGAAVPARPNLLREILRAAVRAASPYGVPVTAKFRMGLRDDLLTHRRTGEIAAEEGVTWIALHARTAEQHYSGEARWDAIAELKQAVPGIPVLGNGDIWEATDALAMLDETGCAGVVVGRGCLGRPWLFRDLQAAFAGEEVPPPPDLGQVADQLVEHAHLLVGAFGAFTGIRELRRHTSWYLQGFPVGGQLRRALNQIDSLEQLRELLSDLDRSIPFDEGVRRQPRGHTTRPKRIALPHGWLDSRVHDAPLDAEAATVVSGG